MKKIASYLLILLAISSCSSLNKAKPFSTYLGKDEATKQNKAVARNEYYLTEEIAIKSYIDTIFMMSDYYEKESLVSIINGRVEESIELADKAFNGYLFLIEIYPTEEYLWKKIGATFDKIKKYYLFKVETVIKKAETENKINKNPFN